MFASPRTNALLTCVKTRKPKQRFLQWIFFSNNVDVLELCIEQDSVKLSLEWKALVSLEDSADSAPRGTSCSHIGFPIMFPSNKRETQIQMKSHFCHKVGNYVMRNAAFRITIEHFEPL